MGNELEKYLYFQTDLGKLYHGDCREVLPQITEKISLILTDPPYGINYNATHTKYKNGIDYGRPEWDKRKFKFSFLFSLNAPMILWGGNCFASQLLLPARD